MPKKRSPLDYAFAVGKIRAMERFLIKPEVFEEAAESDLDEALKLFTESQVYSAELLHVEDSRQLEDALRQQLIDLKKLVGGLLLDEELKSFLEIDDLDNIRLVCKKYGSDFLNDYIMHLIDMNNIKTFLRLYILKEPIEKLEEALTCEGFIKNKDFLELYSKDLTAILNRLEYVHQDGRTVDYTYYIGEAARKTAQEKSFIYLEKAINDFLVRSLKSAKYMVFGPEPVIAYYLARANEINLMRLILLAKMNNVAGDVVKERLNAVYA